MSKCYHYVHVDVFTDTPFGGNQLAVFADARGLTDEEMQVLAREMNFSESTFVLPAEIPSAAARVRIFTPGKEMPMAGHPTVGTAFVLAQRGKLALNGERTEMVLQLGIGPVNVVVEHVNGRPRFVWMNHRVPEFGPVLAEQAAAAHALGLEAREIQPGRPLQIVSTGVPFLFVPLVSLDAVSRCRPSSSAMFELCRRLRVDGLYVFTDQIVRPGAQIHARMFGSPELGIVEDPATGAAAGPFGAYVASHNVLPRAANLDFVVEQGVEIMRPSEIYVNVGMAGDEVARIAIGGSCVIVGEGDMVWD